MGRVLDVSDSDAAVVVGMGAAEYVDEEKADGYTTGRGVVESREPVIETRDPAPAKATKVTKKTLP